MIKNILVTGGLGLIGSNFVNYMSRQYPDYKFVILDIMDYCASLENIDKDVMNSCEIVIGDIANKELVAYILNKYNITVITHFAAQTSVDRSFYNSVRFTQTNVLATHILLETVKIYHEKTNNIQRFLHISTDEVYAGNPQHIPNTELDALSGTSPYSGSKIAAEAIVMSYYHSYKLPIQITRSSNVIGRNQYPEKVVPKFICQLLNNEKLTIHGTGESLRNFIHIDDACSAFNTILTKGEIGQIYNISADHSNEYNVLTVANKLIKLFHPDINVDDPTQLNQYLEWVEDRKFNDARYFISSDKLHKLGWKPIKTNFDENLKELIEWYRVNKSRYGF